MRNKYTHQHLQQEDEQQYHHQPQQQPRAKFIPMLCSSSTKQVIVKLSHRRNSSTSSSSSSSTTTASEDPMSPRVGCMGQVKRNNKVVGFPCRSTPPTCTNITTVKSDSKYSNSSIVKYHKLKRFFSAKSLTGSPTTTTFSAASVSRSGTHKGKMIRNNNNTNNSNNSNNSNSCSIRSRGTRVHNKRDDHHGMIISRSKIANENEKGSLVNLIELDPPLPVVKQLQQQENNNVSLWKRRSGVPLKGLQLQITQQNSAVLVQPTTV